MTSVTPYKQHPKKNIVTMTSYTLIKYPIYLKELTETHGTKLHYKESDNAHNDFSHDEKDIQVYENME